MKSKWLVRWEWLIISLFLAMTMTTTTMVVHGLANRNVVSTRPTTRDNASSSSSNKRNQSVPSKREDLPTLDVPPGSVPILEPPYPGINAKQFYPPTYTLLRAGPVSFLRRLIDGKSYEQYVWKYMKDYKDDSLMAAQGNADAFLASADDWAEQKYLEGLGRREVFDYGKPLPTERVVLSSVWGVLVTLLASRVVWQLIHGNRNLF